MTWPAAAAAVSLAAPSTYNLIALAALFVAVATFVLAQRDSRKHARTDYVSQLEQRIGDCERDRENLRKEMTTLRRRVGELRDENVDLMRRLVRLEQPG